MRFTFGNRAFQPSEEVTHCRTILKQGFDVDPHIASDCLIFPAWREPEKARKSGKYRPHLTKRTLRCAFFIPSTSASFFTALNIEIGVTSAKAFLWTSAASNIAEDAVLSLSHSFSSRDAIAKIAVLALSYGAVSTPLACR